MGREITINDIYNLYLRKENEIVFNLDTKLTLEYINKLTTSNLKKIVVWSKFKKIQSLGFKDLEEFTIKFKKDCNYYMSVEQDVSINEYINFLEKIK